MQLDVKIKNPLMTKSDLVDLLNHCTGEETIELLKSNSRSGRTTGIALQLLGAAIQNPYSVVRGINHPSTKPEGNNAADIDVLASTLKQIVTKLGLRHIHVSVHADRVPATYVVHVIFSDVIPYTPPKTPKRASTPANITQDCAMWVDAL